jgi:phosphoribosylaminoimidazole-succinocarboxamide synthase
MLKLNHISLHIVDITEHKLVPNHSVLTPQEKQELLERYNFLPLLVLFKYYSYIIYYLESIS